MDPGQKFIQKLKTVPNLVDEDPSTITPKNKSFVDVPWSDFSEMLAQKRKVDTTEKSSKEDSTPMKKMEDDVDLTFTQPEKGSVEDFTLGNWDASTGYQDAEHRKAATAASASAAATTTATK